MMVMPVVALWKKVHNDDGLHDRGCFTLKNSRRQPGLSGPKSATNRLMHRSKTCAYSITSNSWRAVDSSA
jgi:hypothetical protein